MNGAFYGCRSLTLLDISSFNTSKVTDFQSMFSECSSLTEIVGVIDMISAVKFNSMFYRCTALETVTLKNIKVDVTLSENYASNSTYGLLLTVDTLINTLKELWDYSSTTTTKTLTMGTTNINKLANVYVKLIDVTDEMIAEDPNIASKKPCVVCESTDEGAMLITEYAMSKKWNLA
jgi:surface protein